VLCGFFKLPYAGQHEVLEKVTSSLRFEREKECGCVQVRVLEDHLVLFRVIHLGAKSLVIITSRMEIAVDSVEMLRTKLHRRQRSTLNLFDALATRAIFPNTPARAGENCCLDPVFKPGVT
jgi:hypothetical protein